MSPGLLKVAERAKRDPDARFNSLAHLVDEAALGRAFRRIRKGASAGVDGITKEQYGQRLEQNFRELHERLRTMRYRHQPIRRVHIPKANGKTRPIGISAWRTRSCKARCAKSWTRCMNRTFWNARTDSGQGVAPTTRFEP